jgi:ubiquinone/menaquinone biosynthesis C-methylase UbiE
LAQDNITAFWSAIASDYEGHAGNIARLGSAEYAAWLDALGAALPPPPADILDVGTGTGFAALLAAELGHRVTGVDLAEPMMAVARSHARERGLQVTFASGDAVAPPFPPQTFDVVTSRHLIWTLREPETAFRNWRQLLRRGGRLVAIDVLWFATEGEKNEADETESDSSDEPDIFQRYYNAETRAALPALHLERLDPLLEMLERAGFRDITASELTAVVEAAESPAEGRAPYLLVARRRD